MKNIIGLYILSVLCSLVVYAKPSSQASSPPTTKESMHQFLDQFIGLKKYLVSDDEFQDPKNAGDIAIHLKNLAEAVKITKHDQILNQENFKFSRAVLEEHITETERVFRLGNKAYARWMTGSTLGICMSCHTQVPTRDYKFSIFLKSDYFTSDFDRAEFMYATKNFDGAVELYKGLIAGYPKNYQSADRLEKSIQRALIYHIRVKRDFTEARKDINEFLKNKELPEFLNRNLKVWDAELGNWSKRKLPAFDKMKPNELDQFVANNYTFDTNRNRANSWDPKYISNLVLSGYLNEYLQHHPAAQATPEILYWLSVMDREINHSAFYSFADMYLKECILRFPETPMAMKCYKEYEEEMIFGYAGSAGLNIPKEVRDDLKYLKSFVESKGKVPLKRSVP